MKHTLSLTFAAAIGIAGSAMGAIIYPANNGFEVPDLGSGGGAYEYNTVPGWTQGTGSGGEGEAANGSAFGVSGATNGNSDGTTSTSGQAALLQGGGGTLAAGDVSISQAVTVGTGTVSVNFASENRACCSGGLETVNVYVNGALVDSVTPPVNSFQTYSTVPVAVTAGPVTISFAGLTSGGDQTAFIDNVSVNNVVPEPASLGLLGLGGLGLIARRRRI